MLDFYRIIRRRRGGKFAGKTAWMLVLGLAAMDGAFEAIWQIEASSRNEFRRNLEQETFGAKTNNTIRSEI